MKSWHELEPDRIRLIQKHFNVGRGGHSIRHVTRHHMGGIGGVDECWNWWQTRQASAHYAVSPTGEVGQLVWDRDTAWANADPVANAQTIAIEHSNSGGSGQDWPISDVTITEGAKLGAAVCYVHKLGRPEFGKNIRDHAELTGTECPYHLRAGHRYHQLWMDTAQAHYDWMHNPNEEDEMNDHQNMMLQEIWDQLRGKDGRGWPQLGQDENGNNLTPVDSFAALRSDVAGLRADLDELRRQK